MTKKRTNIQIDIKKLNEAKKISGLQTAKETVDFALSRLIRSSHALKAAIRLKGKITFTKNDPYKDSR